MEIPKLYGSCGSVLILPFPDESDRIYKFFDIMTNFKDVLKEPRVLQYLFKSNKVEVTTIDIHAILMESSKECLLLMLEDDEFMERRKEAFTIGRSTNKLLSQVEKSFQPFLDNVNKVFSEPSKYRALRKPSRQVEELAEQF